MKFHDLPLGARFELEGAVYVKSSPVLANKEGSGESRFMARYKVVAPLEGAAAKPKAASGKMLKEEAVLAAFESFYGRCQEVLAGLGGELPAERLAALQAEMDGARAGLIKALSRG